MNDLVFNEFDHSYFLNGERVPSVTQVLSPLNDFGMIRPEVLQHAADRGSTIHRAIELYCLNPLTDDPVMYSVTETLPEGLDDYEFYCEVKPYFEGFKKFIAEKKPTIVSSEQRVFNADFKYAGTMDLLLGMPDLYFVDVKNTAQVCKTASIQLTAYQRAKMSMEPYDKHHKYMEFCQYRDAKLATLWLHNTGKYNLIVHEANECAANWETFTILLNAVHAENAAKRAVISWKERN